MKKIESLLAPKKESQEINIAPLIDIVFILLVFFMVTTTFNRDTHLELERPNAQSGLQSEAQTLRVAIDNRGQITVDGKPINPWMVQSKVHQALSLRTNKTVLLVSDTAVETGRLVQLMDQCTLGGASDVGISVEQGP
jgi:biopolymer transport protein ExbD